eukprot:11681582-Karenia_brevis.AAC.1
MANFAILKKLVPPAVLSACFHTVFNGWVTARRFQRTGQCVCDSRCAGEDSVEHYSECGTLRNCAARLLGLQSAELGFRDFMDARQEYKFK